MVPHLSSPLLISYTRVSNFPFARMCHVVTWNGAITLLLRVRISGFWLNFQLWPNFVDPHDLAIHCALSVQHQSMPARRNLPAYQLGSMHPKPSDLTWSVWWRDVSPFLDSKSTMAQKRDPSRRWTFLATLGRVFTFHFHPSAFQLGCYRGEQTSTYVST